MFKLVSGSVLTSLTGPGLVGVWTDLFQVLVSPDGPVQWIFFSSGFPAQLS